MSQHQTIAAILICLLLAACTEHKRQQNLLSDQETKDGWKLLFDGNTMNGWHLYNRGTIPSAWSVDSGDLINTFSTGPEYQLLDDANVEPDYLKNLSHKAAAIFGVVPNNSNTTPRSNDWNHSRILQQDGKLTFWQNDTLTIQVDLNSIEWKNAIAASSLSKFPEFGVAVRGHLAVQDWTNGVAFRNMKIKELDSTSQNDLPAQAIPQQSADIAFSDTIKLQANENMRFDKELFKVRAGKKLKLIFKNTGAPSPTSMAHNVVILKSGVDIADFADLARTATKDQYIPSGVESLIIAHTKLISGGQSDQVELTIHQPGVYDFICSYPGHWASMQGKIVAE